MPGDEKSRPVGTGAADEAGLLSTTSTRHSTSIENLDVKIASGGGVRTATSPVTGRTVVAPSGLFPTDLARSKGWASEIISDRAPGGRSRHKDRFQVLSRTVHRDALKGGGNTAHPGLRLAVGPPSITATGVFAGQPGGVGSDDEAEIEVSADTVAKFSYVKTHEPRPNDTARQHVGLHDGAEGRVSAGQLGGVTGVIGRPDATCDTDTSGGGFAGLPSIAAMRSTIPSLVIGFDTEFYYLPDGRRVILSWQFVVPDPQNRDLLLQYVFLPLTGRRIRRTTVLRYLIEHARLDRAETAGDAFGLGGVSRRVARVWTAHRLDGTSKTFSDLDRAIAHSEYDAEKKGLAASRRQRPHRKVTYEPRTGTVDDMKQGRGCGWTTDEDRLFIRQNKLSITLVAHYVKADIETFLVDEGEPDVIVRLAEVGGGLVSQRPIRMLVPAAGDRSYPVSVQVRDTVAHAPANACKLSDLGSAVGIPKLPIPQVIDETGQAVDGVTRMDLVLAAHPLQFLDYAINDAVIALEYPAALYGDGKAFGVSLPSAAAKAFKRSLTEYFRANGAATAERPFQLAYAGNVPVEGGLTEAASDALGGYVRELGLEPHSLTVADFQGASQRAYQGGLNACLEVGYVPRRTYDFDLRQAYPTAMSLVLDLDWVHPDGCYLDEILRRDLTLQDFPDGFVTPFVGQVTFEFPETVTMPSIGISHRGSLVYPRTVGRTERAVYATGPEVHLALKLGARVTCLKGYQGRILRAGDNQCAEPSRSLRHGVTRFVRDRQKAQSDPRWGKGSLVDLMLKIAVNAIYGKTAQDVAEKSSWNAFRQQMEEIGGSAITSPYHAAMTTALVRTLLVAVVNQLHELGYSVYSVTTDGFLTDAPEDIVTNLDLYGLAPLFGEAREHLSGTPDIWEMKHHQSDLLNLTTRGNVSLQLTGVLAHAGFKSSHPEDSDADRREFWAACVTRVGRVSNRVKVATGFRRCPTVTAPGALTSRWSSAPRDCDPTST